MQGATASLPAWLAVRARDLRRRNVVDLRELRICQRGRRTGVRADVGACRIPRALSGGARLDAGAALASRLRCATPARGVPRGVDAVGMAAGVGVHRFPVAAGGLFADRRSRVGMVAGDWSARRRSSRRFRCRRARVRAAAPQPARVHDARRLGGTVGRGSRAGANRLGAAGRYAGAGGDRSGQRRPGSEMAPRDAGSDPGALRRALSRAFRCRSRGVAGVGDARVSRHSARVYPRPPRRGGGAGQRGRHRGPDSRACRRPLSERGGDARARTRVLLQAPSRSLRGVPAVRVRAPPGGGGAGHPDDRLQSRAPAAGPDAARFPCTRGIDLLRDRIRKRGTPGPAAGGAAGHAQQRRMVRRVDRTAPASGDCPGTRGGDGKMAGPRDEHGVERGHLFTRRDSRPPPAVRDRGPTRSRSSRCAAQRLTCGSEMRRFCSFSRCGSSQVSGGRDGQGNPPTTTW